MEDVPKELKEIENEVKNANKEVNLVKGNAFPVDSQTNRLITALDGYIAQINSTMGSFLNTPIPYSAKNFFALMNKIIENFIDRTFPDNEKRKKDYHFLIDAYAEQAKGSSFFFQYNSLCNAMLITLLSMREELLVHGLDFKTKIGEEQKVSMPEKIEQVNKRSIELGIDKLLPIFKWKTEKEEKKKLM
jgi:hypothetical protein